MKPYPRKPLPCDASPIPEHSMRKPLSSSEARFPRPIRNSPNPNTQPLDSQSTVIALRKAARIKYREIVLVRSFCDAIDALPDRLRTIVNMRLHEQIGTICDELGLTRKQAHNLMEEAKVRIKDLMKDDLRE